MRKTKFKRKIINAEQRDRERVCVCVAYTCVHAVCIWSVKVRLCVLWREKRAGYLLKAKRTQVVV